MSGRGKQILKFSQTEAAPAEVKKTISQLRSMGSLVGASVVVHSLKSASHWNGREGVVLSEPAVEEGEDGRYEVRLSQENILKIKAANFWL